MKCYICNKNINQKDCNHIYRCAKNKKINDTKSNIRLNNLKYNYNENISLEIAELYKKGNSAKEITKKFNITYRNVQFILSINNINVRGISDQMNIKTKYDIQKTVMEKYNVDNISKLEIIKNKKKSTFIKNYGVDNIFKDEYFKINLKKIMNEKYGKGSVPNIHGNANSWGWKNISEEKKKEKLEKLKSIYREWYDNLTPEELKIFKDKTMFKIINISSLETRIHNILNILKIPYTTQFFINKNYYDIKLNNTKVLIEINGDYWHGNPLYYNEDDILNFPGKKIKALELWNKDIDKLYLANSHGFYVIYIWETELNEMNDDQLMLYILEKINKINK